MHLISPRLLLIPVALFCALSPLLAQETLIEIKAVAGLRYDVPRFKVAPGEKVRLVVENTDDMAHNLIITAPGARMEVANAAMTLPLTPTQDFIPKSGKVLWAIPVLTPGKKGEVRFTAPEDDGVYPYVCTYPGHGMIMYGAMYVTRDEMPPLAKDANVPDAAKELASSASPHAFTPQPPYLYRTFVRDSGPASIAVALPGGNNYVWDAGTCRLRYAWRGAFLDPMPHWRGNGDAFATVKGRIFWRAGAEYPLRFGARENVPAVKFLGYRLVNRYPEFHYTVDGVEVRELIKSSHHGTGLEATFTLGGDTGQVFFLADADNGEKTVSAIPPYKTGALQFGMNEPHTFTVTISEVPDREPLAYFSMDDVLAVKKPLPVPGVKGRALVFDGKKAQVDTGVNTAMLAKGGSVALWVKATNPKAKDQVVLGARAGEQEFALGWNLGGSKGFGSTNTATDSGKHEAGSDLIDGEWHHLAVVFLGGICSVTLDGGEQGFVMNCNLPLDAALFLGSVGGAKFAAATLDEVRIYDRLLSAEEIHALFQGDREPVATPIPAPK